MTRRLRALPAVLVGCLLLAGCSSDFTNREVQTTNDFNGTFDNGTLGVSGGYIASPVTGGTARAYMVLTNEAATPERLIGVTVDGGPTVGLYAENTDGSLGASQSSLAIPPRGQVRIEPGQYALVIRGITPPTVALGSAFRLHMTFQVAGELPVATFYVSDAGSTPGAPGPGSAPTTTPTASPTGSASGTAAPSTGPSDTTTGSSSPTAGDTGNASPKSTP